MNNRKLQLPFLILLLAGILLLSFFILKPFLAPLALAAMFAVVLQPLYRKLLRVFGNREALASLSTVFVSLVCIILPLTFLGTQIFHEAVALYSSTIQGENRQDLAVTVLQSAGQTFEKIVPGTGEFFLNLSANLDMYIKQGLSWLIEHLGVALSGISALLLNLFIFFISLYYLLRDGSKVKDAIIKLSPLDDKDDKIVFERLESAVNSVVKGSLLIALIQGILTTIGFTIFGIPNSILWGTLTVIAALIPGIGTALIIIPGVIYLFVVGNTVSAVGLMIWGAIAVGMIDNVLGPKLVGRKLQIHPLFVLLSVLGGIIFFGPIGIFLGSLTMSLLFAFISIYTYLVNDVVEK
ncbi:MAG: AI-2E family transporter [Candidatus Paceibacterota bacterium]